jgi:hypothetical protein
MDEHCIVELEGRGDGDDDRHDRQSEDEDNVPTWDSLGEAVRRRGPLHVIRSPVQPMLANRTARSSSRAREFGHRGSVPASEGAPPEAPVLRVGPVPLRRSLSFVAPSWTGGAAAAGRVALHPGARGPRHSSSSSRRHPFMSGHYEPGYPPIHLAVGADRRDDDDDDDDIGGDGDDGGVDMARRTWSST